MTRAWNDGLRMPWWRNGARRGARVHVHAVFEPKDVAGFERPVMVEVSPGIVTMWPLGMSALASRLTWNDRRRPMRHACELVEQMLGVAPMQVSQPSSSSSRRTWPYRCLDCGHTDRSRNPRRKLCDACRDARDVQLDEERRAGEL